MAVRKDSCPTGGGALVGKVAALKRPLWAVVYSDGDTGEMDQAEPGGALPPPPPPRCDYIWGGGGGDNEFNYDSHTLLIQTSAHG